MALDSPDPRDVRRYDIGLLILRLGFGLGFVWFHGWGKITGGPALWSGIGGAMENFGITGGAQWWGLAAALAEAAGALCIAAGFLFRPMALALAFVMTVATVNHVVTGQGTPAHSFKNIWVFLGIAVIGPGRYSVDAWLEGRRR